MRWRVIWSGEQERSYTRTQEHMERQLTSCMELQTLGATQSGHALEDSLQRDEHH